MADVSMEMVKELRQRTGAGIMDCKVALAGIERRYGKGGRVHPEEGSREGRQEGGCDRGRRRGPRVHSRGFAPRRARRGQLSDRLRRAQR